MSTWSDLHGPLPGPDRDAADAVAARADDILRPAGALARLDELAVWVAGWRRTSTPSVAHPAVLVFAGDHGVVAEGVSAYPSEVTASMVEAFDRGVATVNALARVAGASVTVTDVGVGRPTGNLAVEPALDATRLDEAVGAGRRAAATAIDDGADLLVLGEMGIGNTTPAAALCTALLGGDARDWVGRGAGIDDDGLARKVAVVERAVDRLGPTPDPLTALAELGGAELAAIAGATVEARLRSVPVLLDGFITTAAVLALDRARPGVLDHCRAGHRSAEPGHRHLLAALELEPLIGLDLRLGEGSGAVAALPLVRMACAAVVEVPTFGEWFGPEGRS